MNKTASLIHDNFVGLIGSTTTWFAVLTARQEELEFWLRCLSYVGALIVSAVTVYFMIKRRGKS